MQECQLILSILMNSSTEKTGSNLALKMDASRMLSALQELANLRDDPAAFERFARSRPGFIYVPESDLPYRLAEPVTGIPNLPNRFIHMWQRRQDLREVWRGNTGKLKAFLSPGVPPEELPREELIAYVSKDESETAGEWAWPPQVELDWLRSQFVYTPTTEFQRAVYELFRRSAFAKVCANPDCPAPYFVAHKTAQRYCMYECAQVFQREWKRRWWKERGKQWRQKRTRGKRRKT